MLFDWHSRVLTTWKITTIRCNGYFHIHAVHYTSLSFFTNAALSFVSTSVTNALACSLSLSFVNCFSKFCIVNEWDQFQLTASLANIVTLVSLTQLMVS